LIGDRGLALRPSGTSASSSSIRNSTLPPSWMSVPRPGHVGGDGDRARRRRLGDDMRFMLVIAGVQNLVLHAFALQEFGQ
jgi:hypothetical protein